MKKEVNRLKDESKTKTEFYEKSISELNAKISEIEIREVKTKTELEVKTTQISELKKERAELQEQLDKSERTNFDVLNPQGTVKVTDTKSGMSYEFEAGTGTKITNSTESTLSTKLQSVTESLSSQTQRAESLSKTVDEQQKTIKQKDSKIDQQSTKITELSEKIKKLQESLAKSVLKKGISPVVWVGLGMFILGAIQILWKIYKPRKLV
ncbi:hypothetical protein EGI11_03370 [Chryseobacterium sp. H3056]|uniref:Uncharacterized protein n=1 Tax=Kaistella daneshvariae TaxID=2487074 RepID=A0A3N0WYR5_9FLAO|nr:hypothetical protein EGI11_03370 [Kaistella daneshvariae]